MWLEELIPNYNIDLFCVPNINDNNIVILKNFFKEWDIMRKKEAKEKYLMKAILNGSSNMN